MRNSKMLGPWANTFWPAMTLVAVLSSALAACGGGGDPAKPDAGDDGGGEQPEAGDNGGGGGMSGSMSAGEGGGGDQDGGGGDQDGGMAETDPDFEGIPSDLVPVGVAPRGCVGGSVSEDTLLLELSAEVSAVVLAASGDTLEANGVACDSPAAPKQIRIVGGDADETVIIDFSFGNLPQSLEDGTIRIDLGGGTDHVAIAATRESDDIKLGHEDGEDLALVGSWPRLHFKNHERVTVSAGPATDQIDASGSTEFVGALRATLIAFGGAGDDLLRGGDGNDELHAGGGDDVLTTGAGLDGADAFEGAGGMDTLTYELRSAGIKITIDGEANDGETDELDNVLDDIETLVGGDSSDEISAGPGDNTLIGRGGDDTLNGGDGQDRFLELTTLAGADVMNGGPGTDSVDYSERESNLTISLCVVDGCALGRCDCASDDGQPSELDSLVNVENVSTGSGDDLVIGSSADNYFISGDGDDELRGEAGDDTLYGEAGDDTLIGGDGEDLLDGEQGRDSFNGGEGQGDICVRAPMEQLLACELY
jgi:Ca2+-binding RTX toxin-like protein